MNVYPVGFVGHTDQVSRENKISQFRFRRDTRVSIKGCVKRNIRPRNPKVK